MNTWSGLPLQLHHHFLSYSSPSHFLHHPYHVLSKHLLGLSVSVGLLEDVLVGFATLRLLGLGLSG